MKHTVEFAIQYVVCGGIGVIETQWKMHSNVLKLIDVQYQHSTRRKWIHYVEYTHAVLFVASLSCYDELVYDGDREVNAMTYQLELFDEVVNNLFLSRTEIILFLNKKDLFAEKIKRVPLSKCDSFGTYDGEPDSFDQTTKYIRETFESLDQNTDRYYRHRQILTHITCALDRNDMMETFNDVHHFVTLRHFAD